MAEVEAPDVPSQNDAPASMPPDDTPMASGLDTEPETPAEKVASKETVNENVPPKRAPGLAAAKRPGTGPTSSATKPTTTSSAASARKSLGGLSKPPTRPAAGSAVRKPATSATASPSASSGHVSQATVGGSGDEKKKPLAAAARRTSLAPSGAHHSPAKSETLAEKRGAPAATSTVRKAATSVTSSSPKPTVKPAATSSTPRATGTTSTLTSRSTPISKPAVSGAVSDAKKRLSTIAGSPGAIRASTTRPTTHSASASASDSTPSKETEELKAKLADSEARVEELQREIASSQEKLLELGQKVEEEAQRVTVAEENIRTQHNDLIEKSHASHKADVEALQAQLAETEVAQKAAQEASLKAIEDAQQATTAKGASETAEALKKIKAEHASALESGNAELLSSKKAAAAASSALADKEGELASLKTQIEAAKTEVATLKSQHETKHTSQLQEHKTALGDLKKSLSTEHESAMSALKAAHSADLAKGSTDATSAYGKQVADLTAKHDTAAKGLQQQLKEAIAASATLEASHKQKSDAQQADSLKQLSKLSKDLADFQATSELTQKQLNSNQENLTAATKKHASLESKIADYEKSVAAEKSKLAELEADAQSKDELLSKVQAELAITSKNLGEKAKEISSLNEKHRAELESISKDYETEIAALQGESGLKEELVALKTKHEELTKAHDAASASHADELGQIKQQHAASVVALDQKETAHQKALDELKAAHAKNLDEAHDKAITAGDTAHAAELEQLLAGHSSAITALKKEHSTSLGSATAESEKRKAVETDLQSEIGKTSQSLKKAQNELNELKEQLALEKMARTTAEADLDAAKSKKPDTSEADALRKELQSLKTQHQASLMTSQQESAKATEEHLAVKSALEKSHADLKKHKDDATTKSKTSESDYKDMHNSMTELVEEANKKAADATARLKEAEANLKTKDAELAEAKTKSLGSPKTPTTSKGLAGSRFAEELDEPEVKPAAEGEQDGSSAALASLAKARLTVQQLDQMNEDLKRDNLRSLESITDVSPSLAV